MLKSRLFGYSDAYILVRDIITAVNTEVAGAAANNNDKKIIFKNCAPFTNCMFEINNKQVDNAKDNDVVMSMYYLTEYSDIYSKKLEDDSVLHNGAIVDLTADDNSDSFKFEQKTTDQINNNDTRNVEIMASLN